MDKPKCKLCGQRHYGMCDDIKAELLALAIQNKPMPPVLATPEHQKAEADRIVFGSGTMLIESGKPAKHLSAFDRAAYHKEYMREFMRRKRAKTKT